MIAIRDMMSGIVERGRAMIDLRRGVERGAAGAVELCERLLGAIGEASGTAVAAEVLARYAALVPEERRGFLDALASRFGPDETRLRAALDAYTADPGEGTALALHHASEPRRQELLRRLNLAPGGTAALVAMREDVLALLPEAAGLRGLDADFRHLFSSWFNRGFLEARRIDWQTPAAILERIIRYEAVHAIHDWDDLRRRIDPPDRRLYAFFHPALLGEPLIFVEVALTADMPDAIGPILAADRAPLDPAKARVATFYSISNCQEGLRGISFGSFLIKQVAADLTGELPGIESFVTLSPLPGFRRWVERDATLTAAERKAVEALEGASTDAVGAARPLVEPLLRDYLLEAKNARGRPRDPVARFHLGNGARLERLNWMADRSDKGLAQSFGAMVNYRYALADIERNHEAYANEARIVTGPALRRTPRRRPVRPPSLAGRGASKTQTP